VGHILGLCAVYYKPESQVLCITILGTTEQTKAQRRHCLISSKAILQSAESW
jgi:hypothetical protein